MFFPLIRISPSSAILISTPGQGPSDGAELVVRGCGEGGRRGGLGHPVALEHRDAAGEEELEDLTGDGGGPAGGLTDVAAEDRTNVFEQLLVGRFEGLHLRLRDLFVAEHHHADLHPELDRLLGLFALGLRFGFDRAVGDRVDLLEHPGDRREIARFDLQQLGDDLFCVPAEVRQGASEVEVSSWISRA